MLEAASPGPGGCKMDRQGRHRCQDVQLMVGLRSVQCTPFICDETRIDRLEERVLLTAACHILRYQIAYQGCGSYYRVAVLQRQD